MIKQLNVFSENRPGKLEKVAGALADVGINIRALKISSDEEYGVVKFIVDDPEKGFEVLKKAGITVSLKDVIAVELDDKPGSLRSMLKALKQNDVNIEDLFGFFAGGRKAVVVLEVDDPVSVNRILEKQKFNLLGSSKLYAI